MKARLLFCVFVILVVHLGCAANSGGARFIKRRPQVDQQVPQFQIGSRVRITATKFPQRLSGSTPMRGFAARQRTGVISAVKADTLFLEADELNTTFLVPFSDRVKVEISLGKRSNAGKGFLVGAGFGAIVGAIIGNGFGECFLADDPPEGQPNRCSGYFAPAGGLTFGLLGAIIGAAARIEKWQEVPTHRLDAY